MEDTFEISAVFNASPDDVYRAWLTSDSHSKMTGGEATCSDQIGGDFTAWDGYISGKNIKLEPGKKIVQAWRTSEFDEADADSIIDIEFRKVENGTQLMMIHSNIPDGHTGYKLGWQDHYFTPMQEFFRK
jgi:activator of HSP90 ATPase